MPSQRLSSQRVWHSACAIHVRCNATLPCSLQMLHHMQFYRMHQMVYRMHQMVYRMHQIVYRMHQIVYRTYQMIYRMRFIERIK